MPWLDARSRWMRYWLARISTVKGGVMDGEEHVNKTYPGAVREMTREEFYEHTKRRANADPRKEDPWAHRHANMRCKTCMWWVAKAVDPNRLLTAQGQLGRCRRHAPTMSGFPAVFQSDWCGDHKLDETKI